MSQGTVAVALIALITCLAAGVNGQWQSGQRENNRTAGYYQPGGLGGVGGVQQSGGLNGIGLGGLNERGGIGRQRIFTINDEEYYLKNFYLNNKDFLSTNANPSLRLIERGGAVGGPLRSRDGSGGGLNYKKLVQFNRNFYNYQTHLVGNRNSIKEQTLARERQQVEQERKREDVYLQQEFKYYCPEYWLTDPIQQLCYRVIKSPRKDWLHAKRACETMNGQLVNVDSIEKHSFLTKYLILDNQIQNQYWVSATMQGPPPAFLQDEAWLLSKNRNYNAFQKPLPDSQDLNTSKKKNPLLTEKTDDEHQAQLQNIVYVNEDRSRFINTLDRNQISYDPADLLQNDEFLDDVQDQTRLSKVEGERYIGPGGVITGHSGGLTNIDVGLKKKFIDRNLSHRNKLVYGFSVKKQRWMFLPKFDYQKNFFICESTKNFDLNKNFQLFLNKKQRHLDYG